MTAPFIWRLIIGGGVGKLKEIPSELHEFRYLPAELQGIHVCMRVPTSSDLASYT